MQDEYAIEMRLEAEEGRRMEIDRANDDLPELLEEGGWYFTLCNSGEYRELTQYLGLNAAEAAQLQEMAANPPLWLEQLSRFTPAQAQAWVEARRAA